MQDWDVLDWQRLVEDDAIPLVFFGRLEERKGLLTFLEALQLLESNVIEEIHIIFLGKSIELQAESLQGLESREYIRQSLGGNYHYSIVSDLFSQEAIELVNQLGDPIVCLTSLQENFPNTALEMGQLPVSLVVSDTGGFRETLHLIGRNEGVHWFIPGDARSLAQVIIQAISAYPETVIPPQRDVLQLINQRLLNQRFEYMGQPFVPIEAPAGIEPEEGEPRQWILGMTSNEEQIYLEAYAQKEYSGRGEIVELGCWLGSASISLTKGLAANSRITERRQRIHAYDRFIWVFAMEPAVIGSSLEGKYKDGDSFFDEYVERIRSWSQFIQVYPGDLTEIGWEQGAIEFLFIDAMKSWGLAASIVRDFFPQLIPGVSLIAHQDFAHHHTAWIHLIIYRLREHFAPVDILWLYPSKVFRYVKPVPNEVLQASYAFDTFSKTEVKAAFDYSLSITPEKMKPNVLAAKVMYFVHTNDLKQAQLEFEQATINLDPSEWLELNEVKKWLWFSTSKSSSSSIKLYLLLVLSAFIVSSLKNQFESKDQLM